MHELSLLTTIVKSVTKIALKENIKEVTSLTLTVGIMSGVEKESLEFCFPIACKNTPMENCQLIIEEVPLKVYCPECGHESHPEKFKIHCHNCLNLMVEVLTGKEFKLKCLEGK